MSKNLSLKFLIFSFALVVSFPTFMSSCSPVAFTSMTSIPGKIEPSGIITLHPHEIDFGNVMVNTEAKANFYVQNNSGQDFDLNFSAVNMENFRISPQDCTRLKTGNSCSVDVFFKPSEAKSYETVLQLKIRKVSEPSSAFGLSDELILKGTGITVAPSPKETLTLVGWYSYRQSSKIKMDNSLPQYKNCPAIVKDNPTTGYSSEHVRPGEWCYEPSGAHGMTLANSDFSLLTKYIFQTGSSFSSVPTLDQLFSRAEDHVSDNVCWEEALFYYGLSYLVIPRGYDLNLPRNDIRFSVSDVDDGLSLISNGKAVGTVNYGQSANFSLHKGKDGSYSALKAGANTVVAVWIDDCRVYRTIVNAKIVDAAGKAIPLALPNVVNGYVYKAQDGKPVSGASIVIKNSSGAILNRATVDAQGFYQFENLSDGGITVELLISGSTVRTKSLILNHATAATAVVDASFGI